LLRPLGSRDGVPSVRAEGCAGLLSEGLAIGCLVR
jgi:hypothetical protein